MIVKELIKELLNMPPEAKVKIIYDGEPRLDCSIVYLARNSKVMLTDYNENVYSIKSRPITAHSKDIWTTPDNEEVD